MFKQIFDKTNGTPKLIQSIVDEETGVERFVYDEDKYTEEMPPSELYEPISYKNGKWQGVSYDEWEYNRSIEEDNERETSYNPSETETLLAQTQMQLAKTANRLVQSETQQAQLTIELTKKEQRLNIMEEQQAKTIMEIAKLKGE